MEQWNKQVISWMLAAVLLLMIAFSEGLPFTAEAFAETTQKVGALPEDSGEIKLFTTKISNEGTDYKVYKLKNLLIETDTEKNKNCLADVVSSQASEIQNEDSIRQEIKKNIPFSKNLEDTWKNRQDEKASVEAAQIPVVAVPEPSSEWDNKVVAKVEDCVNIRKEASEESELAGYLKKGAIGDILEQNGDWTKISSGSATGYVKNEFLAFGNEAEVLANQEGKKVATVLADGLRIRKVASEEAGIITLAAKGETFTTIGEDNGWVSVTVNSGETGYVKNEYVSVELVLAKATTVEEEQAAIKAAQEKEAAEKAAQEKAAQEKAAQEKASKSKKTATVNRESIAVETDDETLLAGLIQLEAGGESYEGKLAVANVVINRVNSSRYPNTIHAVIYQNGQFPGATNGKLNRILANGVKNECLKAARDAIGGNNNIGNYMHFNSNNTVNKSLYSDYTVIGNQCFY